MPFPADFSRYLAIAGLYPDTLLSVCLYENWIAPGSSPALGDLQEPKWPGYQRYSDRWLVRRQADAKQAVAISEPLTWNHKGFWSFGHASGLFVVCTAVDDEKLIAWQPFKYKVPVDQKGKGVGGWVFLKVHKI